MDELEQIKKDISIVYLAEMFNAQPQLGSKSKFMNCKHNPLRSEKTSSLKLVPSTNTFSDFGDKSGSVIDFYMGASGKSLPDTIKDLKDMLGIKNTPQLQAKKLAPIPQQDYMSPSTIRKIFDQQIELNFKDKAHKKLLDEFAPKRVFESGDEDDIAYFVSSVRKAKHEDTTMILIRDEHGHEQCLKYRWKMVGDNMVKWCGLEGVKSNFLYTRLTENPLTIVTEGTSDYLVAILMGYSVISLPSASYKGDIPFELTQGRELIFMGDDGDAGQNVINRLMEETVCDKKKFDYDEFRNIYKLKGTDFKDLVIEYDDIAKFKSDLLAYVGSLSNEKTSDWQTLLKKKNKSVTRQTILETENMKMLIDGLLPHKQITTFVGQPNVGKSALTFAIINKLFSTKAIDNVIYFDGDNPLVYTKDRIVKLMDKNGDDNVTYYTGSTASKTDMFDDLQMLTNFKDSGSKTLVVIDSLKNFINGSINDDKSINPMFDTLQQVRDVFGATIIVLHHTRKGKDEDGKLNYVGSQVIEASSDNMTYISKIEESKYLMLENSKARALLEPKLSFRLDFDEMEFFKEDLPPETKEDDVLGLIKEVLKNGEMGVNDIKAELKGRCGANKVGKLLSDLKGTEFKWKKVGGNGWMISLMNTQDSANISFTETTYSMDDVAGIF